MNAEHLQQYHVLSDHSIRLSVIADRARRSPMRWRARPAIERRNRNRALRLTAESARRHLAPISTTMAIAMLPIGVGQGFMRGAV